MSCSYAMLNRKDTITYISGFRGQNSSKNVSVDVQDAKLSSLDFFLNCKIYFKGI